MFASEKPLRYTLDTIYFFLFLQCSFCAFFCPHVAVFPLFYVSFYWSRFASYIWYHSLVSHIGRAVQLQLIAPLYLGPGWGGVDQKGGTTAVRLKGNRPTNCFHNVPQVRLFDWRSQQKQKIFATDDITKDPWLEKDVNHKLLFFYNWMQWHSRFRSLLAWKIPGFFNVKWMTKYERFHWLQDTTERESLMYIWILLLC